MGTRRAQHSSHLFLLVFCCQMKIPLLPIFLHNRLHPQNLDFPGMEVTPHAECSCSADWSFGSWGSVKNHSAALGWPSSTAMEADTGLKADVSRSSSNSCVSSQAVPSPDLASFSPLLLHSPGRGETPIQKRGRCMGVYFVNVILF